MRRLLCWWKGCDSTVTWDRWTGEVIESTRCSRCGRAAA